MINNVDIIKESHFSWMTWASITKKNVNTYKYIKEAIKDKSNKKYGIIICSTYFNITDFKNTFINNKKDFIKLCYITIKGSIKLHIEKLIFNIKKHFKHNADSNIIFE